MTVHFIWNIIITVAKLPLVLSFHCHLYWIFFLKNGILKCLSCSFSFMTLTFYRIIIIVGNPRIGSPLCDMIGVSSLYRFNINKMHIYIYTMFSLPLSSPYPPSPYFVSPSVPTYTYLYFSNDISYENMPPLFQYLVPHICVNLYLLPSELNYSISEHQFFFFFIGCLWVNK